jgi:chromosomal replication initiator protein
MNYNDDALVQTSQVPSDDVVDQATLEQLWRSALGEIEIQVSRPNFVTWFKNSQLLHKRGNTACVGLPNNFAKEWIENKYTKQVLGALRALEQSIMKVEFVVTSSKLLAQARASRPSPAMADSAQLSFPEFKVDPESGLNSRYSFNTFIVGKSNELAYAAATAIVEEIGKKYNPLFIYGGVGLGKTHLMQALGNEIRAKYQGKIRVKYTPAEKFTNDVIWAIKNKRMETIKEKYRLIDVLILDDIQFIAGKQATEEEFFHTFNALHELNKQIIISSDRPPKFMPDLTERLRSRFEGGMIVDISYPDYELRYAVLKTKAQERGLQLTEDVCALLANKIQRTLRELEGILNKIQFHQRLKQVEITPSVIEEILAEVLQEPVRSINPNVVVKAVADSFEISINDLIGSSRKRELVGPRQIAMFLLRDMLDLSYPNIGERIGKRDHTTALYAYEKIAEEINKNQVLNQKILTIRELISKE